MVYGRLKAATASEKFEYRSPVDLGIGDAMCRRPVISIYAPLKAHHSPMVWCTRRRFEVISSGSIGLVIRQKRADCGRLVEPLGQVHRRGSRVRRVVVRYWGERTGLWRSHRSLCCIGGGMTAVRRLDWRFAVLAPPQLPKLLGARGCHRGRCGDAGG